MDAPNGPGGIPGSRAPGSLGAGRSPPSSPGSPGGRRPRSTPDGSGGGGGGGGSSAHAPHDPTVGSAVPRFSLQTEPFVERPQKKGGGSWTMSLPALETGGGLPVRGPLQVNSTNPHHGLISGDISLTACLGFQWSCRGQLVRCGAHHPHLQRDRRLRRRGRRQRQRPRQSSSGGDSRGELGRRGMVGIAPRQPRRPAQPLSPVLRNLRRRGRAVLRPQHHGAILPLIYRVFLLHQFTAFLS